MDNNNIPEKVSTMTSAGKVINIIVAPTKAFEAIKEKPTILIPMIILPLFQLVYYLLFWQAFQIQTIQMMETQFAEMGIELTREMLEMQMTIQRIITPIGAVVGTYMTALFVSAIYLIIAKVVKSEVKFKQMFSMVLHALIISSLLWVFHMVVTFTLGESNVLAPMTSIVSLLPVEMEGSLLSVILAPIEVFTIWHYAVLYLGFRVVCGFSKKTAGLTIAFSVAAVLLLGLSSMMLTRLVG